MSKAALTVSTALVLALFGCDEAKRVEPETSASLQAKVTIAAEDLNLAEVAALVEREDVRDAASLEALINAEDSTINVDVDSDGKRDFVQVHELAIDGDARSKIEASATVKAEADPADGALTVAGKDGQKVTFELRAVPSSKIVVEAETKVVTDVETETVVIAKVDIELHEADREVVVVASYAPSVSIVSDLEVEHRYVHRIELEHRHDHLVVVGAPFVAWVWLDVRPVYVGHVHLPPGHAKKLGLYWHQPGHGHHGHGHHGGPSKVHVKSKGHGGPSKIHVKSKGHGGPSKVHVKFKGHKGKGHKGKGRQGKGRKGKH